MAQNVTDKWTKFELTFAQPHPDSPHMSDFFNWMCQVTRIPEHS